MRRVWKRNAVLTVVLSLVCAAVFFNARYSENVAQSGKVLGQAVLVDGLEEQSEEVAAPVEESDYFASARLTRQRSRDSARSLLQEASSAEGVDSETATQAAESIQVLAAYTLSEAQIENMITAKGYEDCVVFMAEDGVSVVVSASEDGLQTEDVAKITDIVKQETEFPAEKIKILEVN